MIFRKLFYSLFICFITVISLFSSEGEEEAVSRNDIAILPYLSYASETGFSGGLLSSLNLYNLLFREDNLRLLTSVQYTQKKQIAVNLNQYYLSGAKGVYTGIDFGYKYWPDDFYGVGITTRQSFEESYISREFEVEWNIGKRIYREWTLGLIASFADYSLKLGPDNPLLLSGTIPGSSGGRVTGTGLVATRDRRNSSFFATSGDFIQLSGTIYNENIGGDFSFNRYTLDLRKYLPLTEKQSISFQLYTGYQSDGVPFQNMFQLGDYLRAFPTSRYIDKSVIIARSEYRVFPWDSWLLRRTGIVLFAETGNLSDSFGDWEPGKQKFSFGAGGRYRLIEGEGMLLRFDIGFSSESVNILFVAREAF